VSPFATPTSEDAHWFPPSQVRGCFEAPPRAFLRDADLFSPATRMLLSSSLIEVFSSPPPPPTPLRPRLKRRSPPPSRSGFPWNSLSLLFSPFHCRLSRGGWSFSCSGLRCGFPLSCARLQPLLFVLLGVRLPLVSFFCLDPQRRPLR